MQDRTRLLPLPVPRDAAAVERRVAGLMPYEETRAGEIAAARPGMS